MKIKYIIHPGYVISKKDGGRHYITYKQLVDLYNVNPAECKEFRRTAFPGEHIHLFPNYRGNYSLPKELDIS